MPTLLDLRHGARAIVPGVLLLALLLGGHVRPAVASTTTTTHSAPFNYVGPTNGEVLLQLPGFSGAGALIGVEAQFKLDVYDIVAAASAQVPGSVSFQASGTVSLLQPAAFLISPAGATLSFSVKDVFVGVGNGQEVGGTSLAAPLLGSFATSANLASFAGGPFAFTLQTSGSISPGPQGIELALVTTALGSVSVTYTSALESTPPVPEPATWLMLATGLAALGGGRRRRAS